MSHEATRWQALRQFTQARIALGRVGSGLPTAPLLDFTLSHAQARDAVHLPLDIEALGATLDAAGFAHFEVDSAAPDREHYLRRPDLGRRLSDETRATFDARLAHATNRPSGEPFACDIAFVVADGLSSLATSRHALPLLQAVCEQLQGWRVAPVVIARHARVALGDEIGERLRAPLVAVLIGERPGLSSPDSLGVYLTWAPHIGSHDGERNCISNVRPEGLRYAVAAHKLVYLITQARQRQLTGVDLKDHSDTVPMKAIATAATAATDSAAVTNRLD